MSEQEPHPCVTCGEPAVDGFVACRWCRQRSIMDRYNAMPRVAWDGGAPLYSQARDRSCETPEAAARDLGEGETLPDLRLVICEPVYVRPLNPNYCGDDIPYDSDVPDVVLDAMRAFNKAVAGVVLSFRPGRTALLTSAAPSDDR